MLRFIALLLFCFSFASHSYALDKQGYRIGSGDLLSIKVFGEDDLSLEKVRVGTNGTVSLPLLGEIVVKKMTVADLESHLISRFKDGYLKKPVVTVSVVEYRLFYVNGEVKKPGGYNFVDGLTVQKAVALAGGFTERASKSSITLEREFIDKKNKVGLNDEVNPGDIITVDESFF